MRKSKIRLLSYMGIGLPLLILLGMAFFLPELIYKIQDGQVMKEVSIVSRAGLDYAALNTEYEMDLHKRLAYFAKKYEQGTQFYTVSSDYESGYEEEKLLDLTAMAMSSLGFDWDTACEIVQKEYYVIYDDDIESGAAFFCWFLHLRQADLADVRILIDGKDDTIYYMEVYDDKVWENYDYMRKRYDVDFSYFELTSYYMDDSAYDMTATTTNTSMIKAYTENNSEEIEYVWGFRYIDDYSYEAMMYFDSYPLNYHVFYSNQDVTGKMGYHLGITQIAQLIPDIEIYSVG